MKTPFLTTNFTESDKRVKNRFANILNMNKTNRGISVVFTVLLLLSGYSLLVGCSSATIGVIGGADGPTQIQVLKDYPGEMHQEISRIILDYNKNRYIEGECYAEGNIILDSEAVDGGTKIYMLATYGTFNICGDHFEHGSGCGVIPTVLTVDAEYNLIAYQEPLDGAGWVDSAQRLFPEHLHGRVLDISDADADALEVQKFTYAAKYLKSIGKENMAIGYYGDFH